jgi:uncharacterized SAM-binding protein YcdF (DUF218 family)
MKRLRRAFGSFSVVFVILLAVLHFTRLVPAITGWLSDDWPEPKGDTLVVLGAEQLGDGTLGVSSYWRSLYAVRAYRTGGFQRVVVSGGKLGYAQSTSLARAMADFMVGLGVPRQVITLEERSTSTRENAVDTAALIRGWPGTKVLLTSD